MAVTAAQALALRAAPQTRLGRSARPSGPYCPVPRSGSGKNRARSSGNSGGGGFGAGLGGLFRGLFRGLGRGMGLTLALGLGLAFFVLVSVGLLASFRWLEGNDFFTLRAVEVQGMERLTAEEVVVLAGVEQGGSLLDVPIGKVMERLTAYPWIASASVRRELPSSLRIAVQEKVPAWWLAGENGLAYADAAGDPIAPVLPDHFTSLPVLDVEPGAEDLVPDLAADLADLAQLDPAFRLERAAWVRVGMGEIALYFDAPDLRLTLERGEGGPWKLSIARLARVWADLGKRGEQAGMRYVTVKGGKAWAGTAAAD